MSSLKSQLAVVAASNATLAVDRKRRQKLHSASLIYNPKTASTQDYDTIFENAVEALNDLIEIDPHFEIFTRSLFSESSMSIDRNVQTKEEIKNLDNAINGFLMLVSSKWHLAPTLHATEWLVRRFQIHICNAETFLLSTINYYQTPTFKRILNIVKLPPLFSPLSSFVRNDRSCSNMAIIKLFNDMEFLKLYASYLSKCIKKKTTYTGQMLFTSCCFINLIAYNSNDEGKLNGLVPIFLEVSAKLLAASSVDCQIAAHCILVVLAASLPLKKTIILAATETILANLDNLEVKKSSLATICKLFQTLKGPGNVDQLPAKLYGLLESKIGLEYLLEYLSNSDPSRCDKFVTSYIRAIARYDHAKLSKIIEILKQMKLERFEERLIITDLIHLSEILEDKSQLILLFEYFVSINEDLVLRCINALNMSGELFEIKLTTSLFRPNEQSSDGDVLKELTTEKGPDGKMRTSTFKEFLEKHSPSINTSNKSMLENGDNNFGELLSLFIESVGKNFPAGLFLSSFFTTLEGRITFLVRVLISPAAPTALRLVALTNVSKCINSIDKESNVFTLIPCLICALSDVSKPVRMGIKKILNQIAKRPFTKHYFMGNRIYGENKEIPLLSPKDSESWLNHFLNEYLVENYDITTLLVPKKNDKIYMLFWANQAVFMPLPYPKMILFKFINKHINSTGSNTAIFADFISSYLSSRKKWKAFCQNNKTNFDQFESSVVGLIAPKERNDFMIDFINDALKSEDESLISIISERLEAIFESLKFNQQLKIVQNILETAANGDPAYDAAGVLQSLPLDTNVFVSILTQNRIHSDSELSELPKKRRRRSSANRVALQKEEISHIAEAHLRKLTVVLETLDKSKADGSESLLSTLLSLVSDLEMLEKDGGLPVLYAQETLASCLLNTIDSLSRANAPKSKNVRADVVVSAIRNSTSPQVQNKFLLVVGALAGLDSETVLHSVMPIFTFMGAHSIRQDDEYTNQVVESTIKTIVPALLKNSQDDVQDEIEFLLMSFTTALQHVPKHRRVRLYSTLINSLNPSKAFAPFLFLISQQHSMDVNNFRVGDARTLVEFTRSLMCNLDVLEQLNGLREFLDLLKLLKVASEDPEKKECLQSRALFTNGILNFTATEFSSFLQNALAFIDKTMAESEDGSHSINGSIKIMVCSALLDTQNDPSYVKRVKSSFGSILEAILDFIKGMNNYSPGGNEDMVSKAELKDARKEASTVLYHLLSHILTIMPISDFVDAVSPLLSECKDENVKYHLMLVIGTKFASEGPEASSKAEEVVKMLLEIATTQKDSFDIVQVSLNTVGSLINAFGPQLENSMVIDALKASIDSLASPSTEVIISSLTVITNCVQILGVKSIAFYPRIVPPSLKIFKDSQSDSDDYLKEQLQLAILLLYAAFIKKLPNFIMSNFEDILKVIYYSSEVNVSTRLSLISLIVENIDLKEILKVLHRVWEKSVSNCEEPIAISLFLSSLQSTVEAIDKKSATSQSPIFFRLLLALFEFRSISDFDDNTISRIESTVYQVANTYVLKLNDKVFRPLFVILVRWAFDREGVSNTKMTEIERLTSFFKFLNKLQENLKGIITSYFTYLIEPVSDLLRKFIDGRISDINLRRVVLNSLTSSFKYDRDEYWKSTSRFEAICEPLVNQLSNVESVIGKYLVKAIASLAANNNRVNDHNKLMHKLLVNHMQSSCSSNEKLWTVRSLKLIYSKVGESWLALLPQLVPTIAELLEDEDEEVEHAVRSELVRVVENVLGEPFDRYLD
ncbi:hypothetical protein HG536_0F01390 [Torulaspora globosa]|uniref:U3 small nucleolar RNA-associated protein 10 n=1 Tax=Torulaspora globosa TaxID=48254 RepID=A0A7G3ZJX8_9SACH|nr:uncharacterized protein HG536_0F01390 [Torulaspora globosa]QLL33814.1 hypothetical protein HG536_0F01390 [Torulaspora globosa]